MAEENVNNNNGRLSWLSEKSIADEVIVTVGVVVISVFAIVFLKPEAAVPICTTAIGGLSAYLGGKGGKKS